MGWRIPRMWKGGECWIIGGGPSIPVVFDVPKDIIDKVYEKELPMSAFSPYLSSIHGKHVIAVNMAFMLGDWVDLMFFGDGGFYFRNKTALEEFVKPRVTCNPNVGNKNLPGIKFVNRDGRVPLGLSTRSDFVSWNRNSGAAAINLATQMGATLIFLLGFDMKLGGDRQWFHSEYPVAANKNRIHDPRRLPFKRHLQCFPSIKRDADRLGIEIINVNPDSQIRDFPKMTLEEALEYGKRRQNTGAKQE